MRMIIIFTYFMLMSEYWKHLLFSFHVTKDEDRQEREILILVESVKEREEKKNVYQLIYFSVKHGSFCILSHLFYRPFLSLSLDEKKYIYIDAHVFHYRRKEKRSGTLQISSCLFIAVNDSIESNWTMFIINHDHLFLDID